MMRIAILDKVDTAIAFMDNDAPEALHYYNDELHEYLKGNAATFTFSTGTEHDDCTKLIVGNKVSFKYKNKDYYFNIMTVEQDENELTCTCYSTTFEFLNEYVGAYKAPGAMSFQEYINAQVNFEGFVTVDAAAISDRKRTLSWDGESTLLERLYSIATGFDAEIKIEPVLAYNYTLQTIKITAVPEYDEANNRYGIGTFRSDINIHWSKEIESIKRTIDVTDFFTCVRPYGNNDLTISGVATRNDTNSDGQVAWTHTSGDINIYAPLAREQIKSNTVNKSDGWIVRVKTYSTDDPNQLYAMAFKDLKEGSVPKATYDIDGYFDTNIGDSVRIIDEGFNPDLYVMARVIEQTRSFTDPTRNKTTFSNVKELAYAIDPSLVARMKVLIAENTMLVGDITSDNGVVFKNNIGSTTLTAHVYNGVSDVTVDYIIKWYKDGVDLGTLTASIAVFAKDVDGRANYKFEAIRKADQKVIATYDVDVVNVIDGKSVSIKSSRKDNGITTLIITEHDPATLKDADTNIVISDGRGLVSTNIQYYLSTSTQLVEGGEWVDNQRPEFVAGYFYWTRWKTVWKEPDGRTTISYTDPVYDNAVTVNSNTILVAQETSQAAKEISENANKTANGKNAIYYQNDAPSGGTYKVNDIWFDTNDGNAIYYWNGKEWEKQPLADSAISNLDAGKITTGYLAADRIAANSINGNKIVTGTLVGAKIAAGTVTATELATGAVTTDKLDANSVTAAKIAANAITSDKIDAGAITAGKIAAKAISGNNIDGRTITADKIATGSLTATEINLTNVFAQDITATGTIRGAHLIGSTIDGGSITIGPQDHKVNDYGFAVNSSGSMVANNAMIYRANIGHFEFHYGPDDTYARYDDWYSGFEGDPGGSKWKKGDIGVAFWVGNHLYGDWNRNTTRSVAFLVQFDNKTFINDLWIGESPWCDATHAYGRIWPRLENGNTDLAIGVGSEAEIVDMDDDHYMPLSCGYLSYSGYEDRSSSRVVKTNIEDETEESARRILDLRIVKFDFKDGFAGGLKNQRGVIAEETLDVMPEVVHIPEGWDESQYGKTKGPQKVPGVDYAALVPDLIKLVQIQQKQIDKLEDKVYGNGRK